MLLLMMELKGRFNSKMIKKAKFGDVFFDEMGGFESVEKDKVTGSVSLLSPFEAFRHSKLWIILIRMSFVRFIYRNPREIYVLA